MSSVRQCMRCIKRWSRGTCRKRLIQRQLLPKMNALFSVPSPAPVKAALNHLGIPVGNLRLPLVACTPEEEQRIIRTLEI